MDRIFKIHCSQIHKIMGAGKGTGLSQTAITFLQEWYAGDNEQIHSKYIAKGNLMENECIDFAAQKLGLGICEKNHEQLENDYMIGTPDVNTSIIVDTKCVWNIKTLHSKLFGLEPEYDWQMIGYCELAKKEKAVVFYGLLDTPEEANYGLEIPYNHIPENQRWVAYEVLTNFEKCKSIKGRVELCRVYLESWDKTVQARLGKIMTT